MRIGTISTERSNGRQFLSGSERRKCIADSVRSHKPDLLLCAGDALATMNDLAALSHELRETQTTVVVEVSNESNSQSRRKKPKVKRKGGFKAESYLIRGGNFTPLGRQIFGRGADVSGKGNDARKVINTFDKCVDKRQFRIGRKIAILLNCGEINILIGRNKVICLSKKWENAIRNADIVLNPTHDRMGNVGTLKAKRAYLSKKIDGRSRVYVSSSNWNSAKGQKPDAATLHDYYRNGKPLRSSKKDSNEKREYREAKINFQHPRNILRPKLIKSKTPFD